MLDLVDMRARGASGQTVEIIAVISREKGTSSTITAPAYKLSVAHKESIEHNAQWHSEPGEKRTLREKLL